MRHRPKARVHTKDMEAGENILLVTLLLLPTVTLLAKLPMQEGELLPALEELKPRRKKEH